VVVEIAVALIITGLMVLLRIAIVPLAADRAPFAFVFVAGVGATVLAGWRSGLLAVTLGQLLIWYFVLYPLSNFRIIDPTRGYALLISTVSELIVVAIIALYQREVDRAWSRREEQFDLIHQALAEIDHRTTNNYQTMLALVLAQAKRADQPVRIALEQVADRVRAIAMASKQLAVSSDSLGQVRIGRHLGELCAELNQGLSRPGVSLHCDFEDIQLGSDETTWLSIIMNELVTNALKHAFPDDRPGEIQVSLRRSADGLRFEVTDDGVGMTRSARTRGTGLGARLVDAFVKQLGATYKFSSDEGGTRHLITMPDSKQA
jgi:two-component sensor histidine kinase